MAGLLKNESFRMKFAERAIYVARTQFSAERTLPIFEEMKAERASALAFSDTRWIGTGASASSREAQYEIIKNFLTERSQYFIAHISSYFGIEAAETNVYYDSSVKSISIGGKTVASGSVLSSTGEAKITITFTPAAGYTADGILVVNKDGSQSYYKGTSASVALSGRTTVTAIAKKSGFTTTASLTAGSRGIFYLKNNGDLYAWGNSDAGQLGAPTLKLLKVSRIASNVKMVSISNGGNVGDAPMTMILTSDNKIYTVGNNAYGQLGRSGNTGLLLPMENVPQGTVKKISAGHEHSLVLMENGDLYGIGSNASGCIGSTGAGGAVKKLVKIASNVSDMTAGRRHTLYISGGKLYALGDNRWNKLNTSSAQSFSTPVKIADNAKAVFAGEHSSFYIDSSNDLYYFGWRSVTTLNAGTGDGKTHKLLSNVKSVSMQDEHALIFTLDNKVYGWGYKRLRPVNAFVGDAAADTCPACRKL